MIETRYFVLVNIQEFPIAETSEGIDNGAKVSLSISATKSFIYGIYKTKEKAIEKAELAKQEYDEPGRLLFVTWGEMEYEY